MLLATIWAIILQWHRWKEPSLKNLSLLFFFSKIYIKEKFCDCISIHKRINVICYVTLVFDSVSNEYMNQLIYISNSNAQSGHSSHILYKLMLRASQDHIALILAAKNRAMGPKTLHNKQAICWLPKSNAAQPSVCKLLIY